jgi:hypothetical protein
MFFVFFKLIDFGFVSLMPNPSACTIPPKKILPKHFSQKLSPKKIPPKKFLQKKFSLKISSQKISPKIHPKKILKKNPHKKFPKKSPKNPKKFTKNPPKNLKKFQTSFQKIPKILKVSNPLHCTWRPKTLSGLFR